MDRRCVRDPIATSLFDYYVYHYIYPVQLAFALYVTTTAGLKLVRGGSITRNVPLFGLILVDLFLVLTFLPQSLVTWMPFYSNEAIRRLFYATKIALTGMSNTLSILDSWLVLVFSVQCFLLSRGSSFHRCLSTARAVFALVVLIAAAFLITLPRYVQYEMPTAIVCGDVMYGRVKLSGVLSRSQMLTLDVAQALTSSIIPAMLIVIFHRMATRVAVADLESVQLCSEKEAVSESWRARRGDGKTLHLVAVIFALSHLASLLPFAFDYLPVEYRRWIPLLVSLISPTLIGGKIAILYLVQRYSFP